MADRRHRHTVALVVVGVAVAFVAEDHPELGAALEPLKLAPAMILFLFVPILIFESGFNTDVRVMVRNIGPALLLAGPGLLLSTGLIGSLVYALTDLPLASALVFGCLISATDPVAVIALFKDFGLPKRLTVLLEGESVFNDATAIVTFQIILAITITGILDTQVVMEGVVEFFVVFLGGLAIGLLFGYVLINLAPVIGNQPLVHITLTLVSAYGAFIVADHFLETSGIMAVLGAGLMVGYYGPVHYGDEVKRYLEVFWEDAAFVANSLVFLMLGLSEQVFIANAHGNVDGLLLPVLTVILVVLLVRTLVVSTLVPLYNVLPSTTRIDRGYEAELAWGGLRGAIAVALAMSLPPHFPYRWQIIDFTFGVTLFMLLFNATTIGWLVRRLGLDRPSPAVALIRAHSEVIGKRGALERLRGHRLPDEQVAETRDAVIAEYEAELAVAEAELDAARKRLGVHPEARRAVLWLGALAVQHRSYLERHDAGFLSLSALRALEAALENRAERLVHELHRLGEVSMSAAKPPSMATRRLAHLLPDLGWLGAWRRARRIAIHEESEAILAGARAVLERIDRLRDLSGASAEDVADCRDYHVRLAELAAARIHAIATAQNDSGEALSRRALETVAAEGERAAVRNLQITGLAQEIGLAPPEPPAGREEVR